MSSQFRQLTDDEIAERTRQLLDGLNYIDARKQELKDLAGGIRDAIKTKQAEVDKLRIEVGTGKEEVEPQTEMELG